MHDSSLLNRVSTSSDRITIVVKVIKKVLFPKFSFLKKRKLKHTIGTDEELVKNSCHL